MTPVLWRRRWMCPSRSVSYTHLDVYKRQVQGELEQALSLLFRRSVDVVCAGRTDAGVHARGQVVSFDVDRCELRDRTPYNLRRSLNALTCEGIAVRAVEERPRGFSARFDAQWREYKYFLATGDTPPVFTCLLYTSRCV